MRSTTTVSTPSDGRRASSRLHAKRVPVEEAVEASGPVMAAFLSAKEGISYFLSLLADDAGKNPNNPLWVVGAAKLAFFAFLFISYRVLQPQLDKMVSKMEAKHETEVQQSFSGMMDTMEEATKNAGGYFLALAKALQQSTKKLVPIMIGLVFLSNFSDFLEARFPLRIICMSRFLMAR